MRHQSLWLRFGFALDSLWLRFGFAFIAQPFEPKPRALRHDAALAPRTRGGGSELACKVRKRSLVANVREGRARVPNEYSRLVASW